MDAIKSIERRLKHQQPKQTRLGDNLLRVDEPTISLDGLEQRIDSNQRAADRLLNKVIDQIDEGDDGKSILATAKDLMTAIEKHARITADNYKALKDAIKVANPEDTGNQPQGANLDIPTNNRIG